MRYTNDTFESVWTFNDSYEVSYMVLRNCLTDTYHIYRSQDVEGVSPYNHAVKNDYLRLDGIFYDTNNHYIATMDNMIHSDTSPAACVPCGLSGFKPNQDVTDYLLYGKIMSQYSWLTWVKETASWPRVIANILGSKE